MSGVLWKFVFAGISFGGGWKVSQKKEREFPLKFINIKNISDGLK